MNTDKNFLGNERLLGVLVGVAGLLGISFSLLFSGTWIMVVAVIVQAVLLFFMGIAEGKKRAEQS